MPDVVMKVLSGVQSLLRDIYQIRACIVCHHISPSSEVYGSQISIEQTAGHEAHLRGKEDLDEECT